MSTKGSGFLTPVKQEKTVRKKYLEHLKEYFDIVPWTKENGRILMTKMQLTSISCATTFQFVSQVSLKTKMNQ